MAITLGAVILAGCATPMNGPDPASPSDTVIPTPARGAAVVGVGGPRPRFFVEWKADLPGVTRRPSVSEETKPPEYPPAAVRDEHEGVTTLETCVTLDGKLADIRVVQSSGHAVLDTATLDWARAAKFLPAEINGEPFAVCGYRFDHEWRVAE